MGFFGNLRNTFNNTFGRKDNVTYSYENGMHYNLFAGISYQFPDTYFKVYQTNPFLFSAINLIASSVTSGEFKLVDEEGNEILDHPFTTLLKEPNSFQSFNELVMQFIILLKAEGKVNLYIDRLEGFEDSYEDIQMLNIPYSSLEYKGYDRDLINILSGKDNSKQVKFICDSESVPLDQDNIISFYDTTLLPNSTYRPVQRITSIKQVLKNLGSALQTQGTFMESPGGMGIISNDTADGIGHIPFAKGEKEEMESRLKNKYGTTSGKLPIIVTESSVKFTPVNPDMSKYALNETITQLGLIVYKAYDIPRDIYDMFIGGSTFENQKNAFLRMSQSTIQNDGDNIAESLNTFFQFEDGVKLIYSLDNLPIMQENQEEKQRVLSSKVATLSSALTDGVIDLNEYRTLLENDLNLEERVIRQNIDND